VLIIFLLWLIRTGAAQSTTPQPSGNRLLIVSAKKISEEGQKLDIKLQSGDHIEVPAKDVNDHATETVRAALRSQSPRLHLTPPERVVVVNVATLTNADSHGRLTLTLSSGATVRCRADDVRPDPQLTFLRTILTEDIYRAATNPSPQTPATLPQTGVPPTDHPFGPSLEFDTKGVDFESWTRRFVAQVRQNWLIPYAAMTLHGHTALRFTVHRDGAITDVTVLQPSEVEAFTKGAVNAITGSNPTVPLPQEYPDESMVMTVVFYYNEAPAKSPGRRIEDETARR
jgi:TonB family protein